MHVLKNISTKICFLTVEILDYTNNFLQIYILL